MTPTIDTAKTTPAAQSPMTREEVKRMLRDAAFMLHMTRLVKAEMMADRPEAAKSAARKPAEMAAGLGV